MKNWFYIIIIIGCFFKFSFSSHAQNHFRLLNNVKKQTVPFKLLNNLTVIPIEVNGKKLNFIVDSGVAATILFNINKKDSLELKNIKKIMLKGLGGGSSQEAILSKGNHFKIKNIVSTNQDLYVIFDDSFDFSSRLGITIHGIIGYKLLKDFVVKVNYGLKKMTFFESKSYTYKNCKKCETLNLEFYNQKPFVNVAVKINADSSDFIPVKLLIDSGGSDAMWLFEKSKPNLIAPTKYFDDYLGEGLSGSVHGKRTIIDEIKIGKFELKKPTVSFPDSISVVHARQFKERNGSIGAAILKRFIVIFDYKNAKLTLKKNGSFKDPFRYNMSGIEVVHNGKIIVKEHNYASFPISNKQSNTQNNTVVLDYNYKFTFKPSYKIFKISKNSPADLAGLEKDDIIIKINGEFTYNLKLHEIVQKFFKKENTKIKLVIERNGQDYEYNFRLKNMLK